MAKKVRKKKAKKKKKSSGRKDIGSFSLAQRSVKTIDAPLNYFLIQTKEDIAKFADDINKEFRLSKGAPHNVIACDIETTGLNCFEDRILGISFATNNSAWYIPFSDEISLTNPIIREIIEAKAPLKIYHNAKFEYKFFLAAGLKLPPLCHDTLIEAFLAHPEFNTHALKPLLKHLWRKDATQFEEVKDEFLRKNPQCGWGDIPLDIIYPYCCQDAFGTYQLHQMLFPKVRERMEQLYVYEASLVKALAKMEYRGIPINLKMISNLLDKIGEEDGEEGKLPELEKEIYELAGREFDIGSDELIEVLFHELKLPIKSVTATGIPKTDKDTLALLDHEICPLVLKWKSLRTARNTYLLSWLEKARRNPKDREAIGRLHADFDQLGAKTGRLACRKPNLQNVKNSFIKKVFTPPSKRWGLAFFDFKQIEAYIGAHYSRDPDLIERLKNGEDPYVITASLCMGIPQSKVTDKKRKIGKEVYLASQYFVGKEKLAKRLKQSVDQVYKWEEKMKKTFPGMFKMRETVKKFVQYNGYVENMFGRRRMLPKEKDYVGPNSLIQGTAADIFKIAMVRVDRFLTKNKYKSYLVNNVHDELILVHFKEEDIIEQIAEIMSLKDMQRLRVPMKIDIEYSEKSWYDKQDWIPKKGN